MTLPFAKGLFFSFNHLESKMGEVRINLTNFVTVGLMAFVAVYAINKGLSMAGYSRFTTSGA